MTLTVWLRKKAVTVMCNVTILSGKNTGQFFCF
jgi:hypothetical protein